MIETLTTSGYLYKVNRNRQEYQDARDKRKAFWLAFWISFCVGITIWTIALY